MNFSNFLNYQPKTRILMIFLGLLFCFIFLLVLSLSYFKKQPPAPQTSFSTPSPLTSPPSYLPNEKGIPIVIEGKNADAEPTFSGYMDTVIGKTTDEQIAKFPDLVKKEGTGSAKTAYYFPSPDPLRNNLIETREGKAFFKRVVSVTSSDYALPTFSPYLEKLGKAEAEYTGSGRFGPMFITYVYPSKGFAFIVNPSTDGVYEIQSFVPTTTQEYIANWGDDIRQAKDLQIRKNRGDFFEGKLK